VNWLPADPRQRRLIRKWILVGPVASVGDLLSEDKAIAIIESTRTVAGLPQRQEYPALMVRGEGGRWLIYDY
jgi:hypothetical protein